MMKEENRVNKKAVVLLSGGLDSSTTLAIAVDEGFSDFKKAFPIFALIIHMTIWGIVGFILLAQWILLLDL